MTRIIITPGEPAGVGPDITAQVLQKQWPAELIVVCDPDLLMTRAKKLGLTIPAAVTILPVKLATPSEPGKLNRANANYVLHCLETAADACLQQRADALVTGPVHKGVMNDANLHFTGHTEFLAQRCNVKQAVMLFVTPQTKVALATTHLPLAHVPKAITKEKLQTVLRIMHSELQKKFGIAQPNILVCGLNPHAGEQGHLGREEIDIIEPALKELRTENIAVLGPLPADTVFTEKYLTSADAVLAMYHDQALTVVKYLGFGNAVNVTLGLPIIRTSVDHGTALDAAGTAHADAGSLSAALQLAIELAEHHQRLHA